MNGYEPINKVLVIVKDGQIVVRSTKGVETALIVDGEAVELPDDWGDLPCRVVHTVPVTLEKGAFQQIDDQKRASACNSEQLTGGNGPEQHQDSLMRAPYCFDCGDNHRPGPCPSWADTPDP